MVSSNLPLVHRSHRVLPLLKFQVWGEGEINIHPQQIYAKSKRELIIKGGVMSSEYGTCLHEVIPTKFKKPFCYQTLLLYLTALEQLPAIFILLVHTFHSAMLPLLELCSCTV